MTTEFGMNHLRIFCATVLTVFTSLPWGLLLFSALQLSKKGNVPSVRGANGWLDPMAFESNDIRAKAALIDPAISADRRSRV